MFHDFRFAFRLLWRESRHTLSVCLTMPLAIGATTLLFAVTYGVLMRPLPWPNASRLVLLNETRGGNPPMSTRRVALVHAGSGTPDASRASKSVSSGNSSGRNNCSSLKNPCASSSSGVALRSST